MPMQPALFVSHGAPSFVLEPGDIGRNLGALGAGLQPMTAVVVISPHWMTASVRVTSAERPPTIHDFRGFDPMLHEMVYPAPGDPALASRIAARLSAAGWPAGLDGERGLDHGAWVPLMHLLPEANIPVVQVSLPARLDPEGAWELGKILGPLGGEGVLLVGSGSLTHNLHEVFHGAEDIGYAGEFARWIRDAVRDGDGGRLRTALERAPHARRAHPTPEHFWPLLIAAAGGGLSRTAVIEGGMRHKVLSMDAFVFGSLPQQGRAPVAQAWRGTILGGRRD